jgi:TPR repeat protein
MRYPIGVGVFLAVLLATCGFDASANDNAIDWRSLQGDKNYSRAVLFYKAGKYPQAAAAYDKSCESSYAAACTDLGVMYRLGLGVRRNYKRAAELYQRGCKGGNALGCTNLGLLYWYAFLPKDYQHAADLFRQGCIGGDGGGCLALGFVYEKGFGVQKDESRAADLFEQACVMDKDRGCVKLGAPIEGLLRDATANPPGLGR